MSNWGKNYKKLIFGQLQPRMSDMSCSLDQHGSINTDQDTDLAAFAANSP